MNDLSFRGKLKSNATFRLQLLPDTTERSTYTFTTDPSSVRYRVVGLYRCLVTVSMSLFLASMNVSAADVRESAEMLRYKLTCSIDEERSSIECEAEVWIRLLRDSLPSVTWSFPSSSTIISIQDVSDNKMLHNNTSSPRGEFFYDVVCPIPLDLCVNDSVLFRIRYTVAADSSASADVFIGLREFILLSGERSGWVPLLSASTGPLGPPRVPVVLEVLASSDFALLSGGIVDSLYRRDGNTVWKIVRSDATGWEESFCLAGSKDVRPTPPSGDTGACVVTLYTSPSVFQPAFAGSIARMLNSASRYYSAQTYRPQYDRLIFACIGTKSIDSRPVRSGNLVLLKNSPEYAVFDSSVFSSSTANVWLQETARVYAFTVPDSSYWFNESWAGYLSTRFLFAYADSTGSLQTNERAQLLARALDFFPTYPIATGRTSRLNEDAVFLYKGRYVFMMLESLLGTETFDSVMRQMSARSRTVPPAIADLQSLCESAYGSSLSWFFNQWLYRTGIPEYVLTSHISPTPRGTYEVAVTVTQRADIFVMPLNIYFEMAGKSLLKRIMVKEEEQHFSFTVPALPTKIDWNPRYVVLRWIPRYRILAHARTSISYRVFNRDLVSSEKEAQLTLQLDPDNNAGANGIALFSLGKAAGAMKDWASAADYFLRASQQRDPEGYAVFPLLSVVRRANVMEVLGNREKAVEEYNRALVSAQQNPLLYWAVIVEAARFLRQPFVQNETVWYDYY
jgi:hypothetical protein